MNENAMTKERAQEILSRDHGTICLGPNKYNPNDCELIKLYYYIKSNESYIFMGGREHIIDELKEVFNARITLGETLPLFIIGNREDWRRIWDERITWISFKYLRSWWLLHG